LDLSKDDISEMLALAKKQQEEQFGGRELPTRHLEEDDASKLITVQYADNWQENLMLQAVKVAREFSADAVKYPKLLLADEMDTVIADNNNKVVNNGEKPAQARFPLKVKFTPWTKERFLQCRKFDLEYSKDWDEELDEETAVFAKDNDAKREQFTLSVFDKQGNRLEPKEKPAKNRFPLLVKMIPIGPAKKLKKVISYSPAGGWKEKVSQIMKSFMEELNAKWEEVGTAVTDKTGKIVGQNDFPSEKNFPITVNLMYVGPKAAPTSKSFQLEYIGDGWKEIMKKRIAEFTAVHGLRPNLCKMDVHDRNGEALPDDDHATEADFPLTVRFEKRDEKNTGSSKKRRRRRKSSSEL